MSSHKYKILMLGSGAVGKTSLVYRFINDKFQNKYETTVGIDISTKDVEYASGESATLSIWDIGGQQRFDVIRNTFYRGATGALLVFDLTRAETFNKIKEWLEEVHDLVDDKIPFVLIGNKIDLIEEIGEVIDRTEARNFAEKEGSIYIETSAKTGERVEGAFTELTRQIMKSKT